ncbi:MAG: hypothetical protein HOK06_07065 [Rhodospirillaceae bacterium]|jgi:hypothetical protein|nr:hypothetical protein [Rhodospirillaceae bacterium]MBT5309545.1 hypothetical protein [Rhodospirillaceae bacterium]MBT6407348.1 hypothetical protein [Rhodospirillaceae bacterium]MBT7356910.1 hypothetical protein [Rhodospirillaceae bacterium]
MTAAMVMVFQVVAAIGFGAVLLRGLGLLEDLNFSERLAWGFAIGYGTLGWLLFFLGVADLFSAPVLLVLLGAGVLGLGVLKGSSVETGAAWNVLDKALLALIILAMTFDLLEGLAPPADADSLAYHFALPKMFLGEGGLSFVPRALDGAVPLLNQMTYIPALALGGERAMTLWTMVSGWGASALLYVIARRFLDRRFSLVVALVFLTTPAVVYSGGSGHVEVRNALFALVAAISVANAVRGDDLRHAALAGLAVGFFMAGKYIGLLFAAACGLAILAQRRWFIHGLVLTLVAVVAGGQWYVWNWVHTGDPVFPMLFGMVDYSSVPFWDADQHAALQQQFTRDEQAVSVNPFWLVGYPFLATFAGPAQFESGRTGFGPYILLVLPFALAGVWRYRARLRQHPLLIVAVVVLVLYVLWFTLSGSQKIRHILPVLPLLLLVITVAAERWARHAGLMKPLAAAVALTLGLQLAGHGLHALNYAKHAFSDETREEFFQRNVHSYGVVPWINANLTEGDKLYLTGRQLNYLLDVPYYYASVTQEGGVDLRPEAIDEKLFLKQIIGQGVTHLLVGEIGVDAGPASSFRMWRSLLQRGCLGVVGTVDAWGIGSRTLGGKVATRLNVLKINDPVCDR